ncbi:MAG: beta-ketoacyl-[acyl-carrier-protein] synthase family protein [Gemmatimonadota bacterium]|nr:beta-ketoacyl-[acyl-carrier-protein] synthase family protein [Gemmatimonadota bacterium]MDH3421353.1 beta-ketoacyl-[acyl-carrier-protein] synthase family protein [Gemmatimonadota bacterium]
MSPDRRSVVITGIGPVTASGIGVDALSAGLRSRRSPVADVTRFDATPFRSHMAAEIPDFEPEAYMEAKQARRLDRFVQFSLAGARLAMEDASLDADAVDPTRAAIEMGSAMGGIAHAEDELRKYLSGGARTIDPRLATTTFAGAASCHVAIQYGFTGPNTTNAMSCAAGAIAIGNAARLIRDGVADVAIAGGVDAPLAPVCYGAFSSIRAMSTRNDDPAASCRPFDKDRDGFVMGEGACIFVLEAFEHARARGARMYAEVRGYGTNNDAYHMAAPRPDGSRAAACILAAIESAGLAPSDVGHVNAHGSSTALNDSTETKAIRAALGEHAARVPVTGTKPYHGHALGASGAMEAAIACLTMRDGWIPPTLNLLEPGVGCDLDYVTGAGRDGTYRAVLSNSFGFGGINAVLLLTAPSELH